jgi:hypothetical protein
MFYIFIKSHPVTFSGLLPRNFRKRLRSKKLQFLPLKSEIFLFPITLQEGNMKADVDLDTIATKGGSLFTITETFIAFTYLSRQKCLYMC